MPKKAKSKPKKSKESMSERLENLERTDQMILKRIGHVSKVLDEEADLLEREGKQLRRMEAESEKEELLKKGKIERFEIHDFAQIIIGTLVFAGPEMFTPDFWMFLEGVPTPNIFGMHLFVVSAVFVTYYYRYFPFKKVNLSKLRQITKRILYIYFPVLITVLILLFTFNVIIPADPAIVFVRKTMIAHTVGMIGAVTFEFLVE